MTKNACHIAYGCECGRAYGTRMAAACAGLALGATAFAAEAGAWEEFERRCLVPMENVQLEDPDDLVLRSTLKLKARDQLARMYQPEENAFTFKITDSLDGARTNIGCAVSTTGKTTAATIKTRFKDWSDAQLAAGRYETIEVSGAKVIAPKLQSTVFREPKMQVFLRHYLTTDSITMEVQETDLES